MLVSTNVTGERAELSMWFAAMKARRYDATMPVPSRFAQAPRPPCRTLRADKCCAVQATSHDLNSRLPNTTAVDASGADLAPLATQTTTPVAQTATPEIIFPSVSDADRALQNARNARETKDIGAFSRAAASIIADSQKRFPSSTDGMTAAGPGQEADTAAAVETRRIEAPIPREELIAYHYSIELKNERFSSAQLHEGAESMSARWIMGGRLVEVTSA